MPIMILFLKATCNQDPTCKILQMHKFCRHYSLYIRLIGHKIIKIYTCNSLFIFKYCHACFRLLMNNKSLQPAFMHLEVHATRLPLSE